MRSTLCRLASILLLAWAGAARAEAPVFDLIPENAAAGVAIRNLDDLQKKGDELVKNTEWKAPARPSELFAQVCGSLGIKEGLDPKGSAAIVLANPKEAGFDNPKEGFEQSLVLVVPFTDIDKMAANFEIAKGKLKPETMVRGKGPGLGEFSCYARGQHVYLGKEEKAILSVVKGKSSAGALTAAQRRSLGEADILLHVGTESWGSLWTDFLKDLEDNLPGVKEGGDPEAVKQLREGLAALRFVQAGLRLRNDGVLLQAVAVFDPKKSQAAEKLLRALQAGPGSCDLKGLPEGRVLAALGARGNGLRNAVYARMLLHCLHQNADTSRLLFAAAERPTYLGVFSEVWKRVQALRVAVYHNAEEQKRGLFGVVAILDTEDPEQFLAELRGLMRLGDAGGLKLGKDGRPEDVAEVERLILALGNDAYSVREEATTKLCLIGEPALAYLEKALQSSDAEVRRRAEAVKDVITSAAEERRKELLTKDVPHPAHPTFTFIPKAQVVDGTRVDVVQVKLSDRDKGAAAWLRQMFGPDWDKVRVAVHGKQVVILIGSEEKLLQAALANLEESRPGLAAMKPLEMFAHHAEAGRKVEAHVSLQALLALLRAEDLKEPAKVPSLTSLTLTVDAERLQLDVILPNAELGTLLNEGHF